MYQLGFTVSKEYSHCYSLVEEVLGIKIKRIGGVCASVFKSGRTCVAVACERSDRNALVSILKEILGDMIATAVKYEYLKKRIKLPIDKNSYDILIHTLVAFDRDNERELINSALIIEDGMSLDGIFNFRLGELRARWNEIARLATDNAFYLLDEDTLNELIRFLISAVSPKITRLDVSQQDDEYSVCGKLHDSEFVYNVIGTEQLMLYLIDVAPIELNLKGNFTDKQLYERLVRIFDAKRGDNCETAGRR